MIVTCKKQVPFRWIAFAILPWASFTFNGGVIGVVFFFSLKKFIENPAGLTFILSLPSFVSLFLQPIVSFLSDRVWTRFGRRKPFVVFSLTGIASCLVLLPLMPNFWALLAVYMIYNAFGDFNSPMEPLKQEIIPPHERGRATGAMTWCSNLATMTFYFVALGRFDDVTYMHGVPLRGETAIYWSAALLLIVMVMLVALGIRELDQKSALRGQRLTPRNFFGGLMDRELWPVYMLVVGASCLNFYSGLGPLSNLLYTDQWGYTKQEMGINVAVGGIINLFVIGLLTIFADKLNRMRAYQTLICLSLGMQVAYCCYINFVLPDRRPTLVEIIVFGETISILSILTGLIYTPLVYDYIRRNKMGTFNAGAQVMGRLTTLITLNGVGLFVWAYAVFFQPPAGDMTRVVLRGDQTTQADVTAALRSASWTYPADGKPAPASAVSAKAWQGDGTVNSVGRCWEVRLRDADSAKLADERDDLNSENTSLLAEEKMLKDEIVILKGKDRDPSQEERKARDRQVRIDAITAKIDAITKQLDARAKNFHDQVAKVLAGRMIAEGDEILAAVPQPALLLDFPTAHRPSARLLEKITEKLRAQRPDVIDVRPLKRDQGYGITVSARFPEGGDETAFSRDVQAATERIADGADPGLLAPGVAPLDHVMRTAMKIDLTILENPIPTYVSPITRVVNAALGLFGDPPDPRRRLDAIARELRAPGELDHIRIDPGPAPKTLSVTLVLPASSGPAADARTTVETSLLPRIEAAAATQRITVAHPSLTSAYAPMKYDYMSGYLWMFVMGSIGICITIAFRRFEARGLIQKRGVEEARQS
jgi:Na+/melibiose symporter-like transporter